MRLATGFACLLCFALFAAPALAADTSPVGTWQQVDDDTGEITSIIKITKNHDELTGTVVKVVHQSPEQIARDGKPPICTQCSGKRHNQPVEGMVIMWGVSQHGDHWSGGHILDPANGKTYKVKLTLADHGQHLKVRGYVGMSLFGRTQVWRRAAE
jgi:uncharacterized protein (DUF2147 family)